MMRFVVWLLAPLAVAGCDADPDNAPMPDPEFLGYDTLLYDEDILNVRVRMAAPVDHETLTAYADCAVARQALDRGYQYARHVRTNLQEEGGIQRADAVYTVSPTLPLGLVIIDAEETIAACKDKGIPTV